MDAQYQTTIAASHDQVQHVQSVKHRSEVDGGAGKEISRLIEDIRRALEIDLAAAAKIAARLAALLSSKHPDDTHFAPAQGGFAPWKKRKVQCFITENLEGALRVKELATLVSLSPARFSRAFKESFGQPPHAYIVKMRVERARALMLTTSESLSQIALACGLADQAHFCRRFRKVTGMTPSAWRRVYDGQQLSVVAVAHS